MMKNTIKAIGVVLAFVLLSAGLSYGQHNTGRATKGKILFVLTSHGEKGNTGEKTGFFLSEAAHPWEVLTAAGYEIDYVSPKGGEAPVDGFNLDDKVNKEFWENAEVQQKIKHTKKPSQVKAKDYVAIHYVGGHGAMWDFADNKELAKLGAAVYEQGGVVSAVCHGPAGLVNLKLSNGKYLVDGKKVAAFTNAEEEDRKLTNVVPFLLETKLIERGANHIPGPDFKENVQVDGRLVTGQNPASAKKVGEEVAKLLSQQESL